MARITKKDAVEFTIKNFDLRIDKMMNTLSYNEFYLNKAKKENDALNIKLYGDKVENLKATISGYEDAQNRLRHNKKLNKDDIRFVLKSLNVRLRKLNENLKGCKDVVAREKQSLIDKKDTVSTFSGIGVVTQYNEEASLSAIEDCKRRIARITNSLALCNKAIDIFNKM